MSSTSRNFYRYVAQTSPMPSGIEVKRAEDLYVYDTSGCWLTDPNASMLRHLPLQAVYAMNTHTFCAQRLGLGGARRSTYQKIGYE